MKITVKDYDYIGADSIEGVVHIWLNSKFLIDQLPKDLDFKLKPEDYYVPLKAKEWAKWREPIIKN